MAPTPPAELLQRLIRFNTSNPPGNEAACINFLVDLLAEAGIPSQVIALSPERPNLVARLSGRGASPPLLLYGHVDVVTTEGQQWSVPPFEGRVADGYVWGRGALDMKGGVATLLTALLRAHADGVDFPGDVIFSAMADEEAGSDFGAKFLVEQHPGLLEGVRYAFSEFGGFNLNIGGQRLYPIQVAEKQACWLTATFRGPAGHASMPKQGGAMAGLGRALNILDHCRLPVRITPPVRAMIEHISGALPFPTGYVLGGLLNPRWTDLLLDRLGARGEIFAPLLHNTACPTRLRAGELVNVIPGQVELDLDGRLVPGVKPQDLIDELHALLGPDVELKVLLYEPGPTGTNLGLFDTLAGVLKQLDPQGVPVPYVNVAVTDARYIARLGIQTYGFTPLRLPEDFNFIRLIHAADERVPVAGLEFGVEAVYQALKQF